MLYGVAVQDEKIYYHLMSQNSSHGAVWREAPEPSRKTKFARITLVMEAVDMDGSTDLIQSSRYLIVVPICHY